MYHMIETPYSILRSPMTPRIEGLRRQGVGPDLLGICRFPSLARGAYKWASQSSRKPP